MADGAVLLASFLVAYALRVLLNRVRSCAMSDRSPTTSGCSARSWRCGSRSLAGLGGYGLAWTTRSRAWLVGRVSGIGLLLLTAALFFVQESEINRSLLLLFAGLSAVGLAVERGLVLAWLRRRRGEGAGRTSPSSWAPTSARRG